MINNNISVNQRLDNKLIQIIAIANIIQAEYLRLKLIDFNEKVGILLIIIRPIINKLMIFKYGFLKNKKSAILKIF